MSGQYLQKMLPAYAQVTQASCTAATRRPGPRLCPGPPGSPDLADHDATIRRLRCIQPTSTTDAFHCAEQLNPLLTESLLQPCTCLGCPGMNR